ncbi:50S ribosomal protein L17 [bacterium]|nr:50S ribosomal protein L17 [bacterium]
MRHRVGGKKLNRDKDHRAALLKNLASSLILNGKIETSVTKAKFLRPFVERLITKAKDSSFNSLRVLRSKIGNEDAIRKLITEVAPKMKDRNGGYTRISKLGIIRKGDNSELATIELVTESKKPVKNEIIKSEEEK